MIIQDIALFILDRSGLPWTLGENFFAGYLPIKNMNDVDVPPRCMAVLERTPGVVIGELPDRVDKAVQVWNRAASYFQAAEDARQIFEILHGAAGWELPAAESGRTYYVMTIDAIADPAPIAAPNARGLYEFSTNYIFRIEGEPPSP